MAALSRAVGFEAQHVGRALQAPEMEGRGDGVASTQRLLVSTLVDAGTGDENEQPRRGIVVGCLTPVLCRAGAIACCWATCVSKGRG